MKLIIKLLPILFMLLPVAGKAQEAVFITSSSFDQSGNYYHPPTSNSKKGLLETTRMSIGTIYKSRHFRDENYNETHNGIYLTVENWSVGTYENSGNAQSTFVTYNSNLYSRQRVDVNLVAGVADGYEGWEYAQNGYLPIVGLSAQWMYLKTMVSPEFMAFGIELPLN